MDDGVTKNAALGRYELVVDGETAFTEFEVQGDRVLFPHTVVPDAIGGRGVGQRLVLAALKDVEAQGLTAVAQCSFVAKVLRDRVAI